MTEPSVAARGLPNYWGYSTLGFFAPDRRLASRPDDVVREFKEMVKALHAAGIEVVLDVVYNHTCECGIDGPMVSLRGLDNAVYYRLRRGRSAPSTRISRAAATRSTCTARRRSSSWRTACATGRPRCTSTASASTSRRRSRGRTAERSRPRRSSTSSTRTRSSRRTKLIAEPWDLGVGGYQAGNFPILWAEWNGRYRDAVRRFWRGDRKVVPDLATRIMGSSDLYEDDGRHPPSSINFITAHDGFTLRDLVVLRAQAQRGERREQPRRDRRQPVVQRRRRGGDLRPEGQRRPRTARARHARDAAALAGGPHAAHGRRGRPHAAREQQRLLPGQRDVVDGLGAVAQRPTGCSRSCAG